MRHAFLLRLSVILFALILTGNHSLVFGKSLSEVIQTAFEVKAKNPIAFIADNIAHAQLQTVKLAHHQRQAVKQKANVYANLYYARRLKFVLENQFTFVKKQVKVEKERFTQGLTTRTNLDRVKIYKFETEKKLLEARHQLDVSERLYREHLEREPPLKFTYKVFDEKRLSLHFVADGISLSHPRLMRQAYRIKNARANPENESAEIAALELSFDETLQDIKFEAEGILRNYLWLTKQMELERKQAETTKSLYTSVLEAHKHGLKNTPELLGIFDIVIQARIDFLKTEEQTNKNMINLLSLMGKLLPPDFENQKIHVSFKLQEQSIITTSSNIER